MLAGRALPPNFAPSSPSRPPPPVATFFNIPRRYSRTKMQAVENPRFDIGNGQPSRNLRKSIRRHDAREAPTSSPGQHSKESRLPSPAPSSPRARKKRAISTTEEVNGEQTIDKSSSQESVAPTSASSTGSGELTERICLCQPEPKIPRPRNAFILYRQHHQRAIVASNPGLANPEISKIIGERWNAESGDQKKIWQELADKEKSRHQEQYPDYRYQPQSRRLSKPGALPSNPSGKHTTVDKYRCPKCGGRSIRTPSSPFSGARDTPRLPTPIYSEGLTSTTRYLPIMSNLSLESPARRRTPGPSSLSHIHVPTTSREDQPMHSPVLTPDSKRRRYNNYPAPSNNYPNSSNGRRPEQPHYPSHARRDSLPPIRQSPPISGTMPPPRTPRELRRGSVDLNVLVPNAHDQSRSVEAMVMSVPYQVKIKVLGRITPPLKDPGPTSPAIQVRGAIIAIEGDDLTTINELSEWLHDFMARDPDKEYRPKICQPPKQPEEGDGDLSFEQYLDLIKEWHARSRELVRYITTPISPPPSESGSSVGDHRDDEPKHNDTRMELDHKDTGKPSSASKENFNQHDKEAPAKDRISSKPSTPPPPSSPFPSTKPIVILPTYQLRASDAYTSRIPIQDAYSPTDHWQWMATLWRGTVGPDLTIYIKSRPSQQQQQQPSHHADSAKDSASGSGGAVGASGAISAGPSNGNGGGSSGKLVELDDQVRCLTVHRDVGVGSGTGGFKAATLRRVGFEVVEWLRQKGGA